MLSKLTHAQDHDVHDMVSSVPKLVLPVNFCTDGLCAFLLSFLFFNIFTRVEIIYLIE